MDERPIDTDSGAAMSYSPEVCHSDPASAGRNLLFSGQRKADFSGMKVPRNDNLRVYRRMSQCHSRPGCTAALGWRYHLSQEISGTTDAYAPNKATKPGNPSPAGDSVRCTLLVPARARAGSAADSDRLPL